MTCIAHQDITSCLLREIFASDQHQLRKRREIFASDQHRLRESEEIRLSICEARVARGVLHRARSLRYILLLSPQGQFSFLGGPPAWAIDETTLRNVVVPWTWPVVRRVTHTVEATRQT